MVQNNKESNGQPSSREEHKAQKKKTVEQPEKTSSSREERKIEGQAKLRERIVPIWLRIILVLLVFAFALAAGLAVGYGVIGDGDMMDVFDKETWNHIVDLVKKDQ
ncbi:DNA-directed RNA polymerase subunit beta [Pseudalkalibacillus sp. SCS-8]|uniref:DNA-directed RNA polymerase subunit beta n=1 Tax=Pseudalkalibacillus nanhaiensis TaxID=3115291 RepID=UPI0032DB6075